MTNSRKKNTVSVIKTLQLGSTVTNGHIYSVFSIFCPRDIINIVSSELDVVALDVVIRIGIVFTFVTVSGFL